MKKVVSLMAAAAIVAAAATALAGIATTKHDLTTSGSYTNGPTGQICVYCHTPHNAVQNIPLWNRSNPAGTGFSLYSSPTMKNHYGSTGFTSDSISLFCMSCHDGGSLTTRVMNKPSDWIAGNEGTLAAGSTVAGGVITNPDTNLTTNLMNDHPVNINITDTTGLGAITNGKMLNAAAGVTNGMPLFKSLRGSQSLECASCHAVHDNTSSPFLRTSNSGSKLCLACHVK